MKANINGTELYYELSGKEGAPWLVLSHSLACNVRMWDPTVAAFKDRFRILNYDMRGHGQSAAPRVPYTLDMLADDALGLMKQLGIQRAHFAGLSIGGMIGQTIALKNPSVIDKLVLADTGHSQPPEAVAQWKERIAIAESKGMQALVESTMQRWFTEPFRKTPEALKIAAIIAATPVAGYVGCAHAIMGLNTTPRLKEIRMPVLAIAGEQDPSTPGTRYLGENIPGAKLVIIPNAAHIANVEKPAEFNRALSEFLSSPASA
ncbi:MAG TPA: 3-oxoadipate enol-lactonase [Burkholderiales bacterium]|nr:3-oxoadipate enol-lactonase [Burkholderiales bacterium]